MNIRTLIEQLEVADDISVAEFKMIYEEVEKMEKDLKEVQDLLVKKMRGVA